MATILHGANKSFRDTRHGGLALHVHPLYNGHAMIGLPGYTSYPRGSAALEVWIGAEAEPRQSYIPPRFQVVVPKTDEGLHGLSGLKGPLRSLERLAALARTGRILPPPLG
jgi:hypothetical protein